MLKRNTNGLLAQQEKWRRRGGRSPASTADMLAVLSACITHSLPTCPTSHPSRLTAPSSHRPTACKAELPADRGLLGVLGHMLSGKSLDLLLAAAAATGKLKSFARKFIK